MPRRVVRILQPLALILITLIAYAPALRASYIWDDPDYITHNPTLRGVGGLWTMWTDPTSLPQWYPLVHTSFWIEYQLWGLWWPGFHLTNVLLHAASACVLLRVLRELRVPNAILAAAVFAVHPVHVESVAWVTERKNTLSGLMYLLSLQYTLRYLGITRRQRPITSRTYLAAGGFYLAALLSKTVTATLPAAALVLVWWKRGTLRGRDLRPLLPMFAVGLILASHTAYLERTHVGASGPDWQHADSITGEVAARTLIAGRAVWFYFGKLIWPSDLRFIYPRWSIDLTDPIAWLWPAAAALLLAGLWLARRRLGRGPLAAALLFGGTLFPALGYFNVYPHRFSFVADHFQYLASIAPIALLSAALTILLRRAGKRVAVGGGQLAGRRLEMAVVAAVVVVLIPLTFAQSRKYYDARTLWSSVVEREPGNWLALLSLGHDAFARGEPQLAESYYLRALEFRPDVAEVQFEAGNVLVRRGQAEAARDAFERAIAIDRRYVPARAALAQLLLTRFDDVAAARREIDIALEIAPRYAMSRFVDGLVAEREGDVARSVESFGTASRDRPDTPEFLEAHGRALLRARRPVEAVGPLERVTVLRPDRGSAWALLAEAYRLSGRPGPAAVAAHRALELEPDLQSPRQTLRALGGS